MAQVSPTERSPTSLEEPHFLICNICAGRAFQNGCSSEDDSGVCSELGQGAFVTARLYTDVSDVHNVTLSFVTMARGELFLGEYFFASSIHRVSTVCITILLLDRSGQQTPDQPGATEVIWHAARAQNSMEWLHSPPAGLSKIVRMWARRFLHLLLLWDLWILEEEAWGLVRHHRDAGDLGESVCVWLPVYLLEQTISLQTLEDSQMNKYTLRMMTEPWIKTHGKSTVTAEKHRPVYCVYTLFKQVYNCVLCYFYSSPEFSAINSARASRGTVLPEMKILSLFTLMFLFPL